MLPPVVLAGNEHIWHLYVVRVPERDRVLSAMHEDGIGAGVHYPIPMHVQGALSFMGHQEGDFPATEAAARGCCRSRCSPESRPSSRNS